MHPYETTTKFYKIHYQISHHSIYANKYNKHSKNPQISTLIPMDTSRNAKKVDTTENSNLYGVIQLNYLDYILK